MTSSSVCVEAKRILIRMFTLVQISKKENRASCAMRVCVSVRECKGVCDYMCMRVCVCAGVSVCVRVSACVSVRARVWLRMQNQIVSILKSPDKPPDRHCFLICGTSSADILTTSIVCTSACFCRRQSFCSLIAILAKEFAHHYVFISFVIRFIIVYEPQTCLISLWYANRFVNMHSLPWTVQKVLLQLACAGHAFCTLYAYLATQNKHTDKFTHAHKET